MDWVLIGIIALLMLGTAFIAALVLGLPIPGFSSARQSPRTNLQNLVAAQRQQPGNAGRNRSGAVRSTTSASIEIPGRKVSTSRLTLKKRLKYAQWSMPPTVFHFCEAGISLFALTICLLKFNIAFQVLSVLTGPIFMRWLLQLKISSRFKQFDADYPQFLLSVVSLLKTGMNVMSALEASARGLEEGSLTRSEVELMIERLRYGVSEDKSIGAFGEDIYHPEIELFVQALLLSRRVGGTLSDTLERLARQVRRRQFFRSSAMAAVSMQRGSIWFIIAILVGIESYLYVIYPEAVVGAFKDEMGWQIWQVSVLIIIGGIFWVRQITKIRI
jgi:tight adherence protein B